MKSFVAAPPQESLTEATIVEKVTTYALAVPIPLEVPPADSHASATHWVVPVVEIETKDGLVGTGISGIHTGADLVVRAIDEYFAKELIGTPVADIREVWQRLYWSPLQWIGRAGATHIALSMIDIAVWDLAARRASLPLWRYLGGAHAEVDAYNTDAGWLNRTVEELRAGIGAAREEGFEAFKIKVGKPEWREDVERVKAVRAFLGDGMDLMCDANKRWDLQTAMRVLPHLEEADIAFIEEPLHPDDVRGHQLLQARTRIPIALGESLYSRHQFSQFIQGDGCRVVQPDVTRIGITEYLEVAAEARAAGLAVVPHAGDMGQVHQHVAAASLERHGAVMEYLPWTAAAFEDPCTVRKGKVIVARGVGASTRVRAEARSAWAIPGIGSVATAGRE
jgi:L-alanine-DL-glutamate epimerase-like enolase superfamily enzyme